MINILLSIYYKALKLIQRESPLAVLYYHHVLEAPDSFNPSDIDQYEFEKQIQYLKNNFNILSMQDAINKLETNTLPHKALAITFDDGYRNNYQYAAPILKKHNVPATFFIATEGLSDGFLWNNIIELTVKHTKSTLVPKEIIGEEIDISTSLNKLHAVKLLTSSLKRLSSESRTTKLSQLTKSLGTMKWDRMMMTPKEVCELHSMGFEIGAHTHTHTILSTENVDRCTYEIQKSKNLLEELIGEDINYFAFPNGAFGIDFTSTHRQLVKDLNFKAAFSTNDGGCFNNSNIYSLPRFMTNKKSLPMFAISIASIARERSDSDAFSSLNL